MFASGCITNFLLIMQIEYHLGPRAPLIEIEQMIPSFDQLAFTMATYDEFDYSAVLLKMQKHRSNC
jgi:hypothetical protein